MELVSGEKKKKSLLRKVKYMPDVNEVSDIIHYRDIIVRLIENGDIKGIDSVEKKIVNRIYIKYLGTLNDKINQVEKKVSPEKKIVSGVYPVSTKTFIQKSFILYWLITLPRCITLEFLNESANNLSDTKNMILNNIY